MPIKQAQSFKRGQLWEAGFDGLYNTDDAIDAITAKVGHVSNEDAGASSLRGIEGKTHEIHRERERDAYERAVLSRAEHFKDAFSRMDLDGDGRLSFEEFSRGLHSLGVILPLQEVKAIWGQVGSALNT
jgi:Ca2+-binding EF-hand superfamily protein